MPKVNGLTPRQARFVQEYCVDLNATQAAIRAGYAEKRASEQGWQLLQKTTVAEAIKVEQLERAQKVEITQEMVLKGLIANIEFAQSLDNPSAVNKAYELLGKHISMFTDKVEHSGTVGVEPSELERARRIAGILDKGSRVEFDA